MTTILIVEDNETNLRLLETVLSANGYDLLSTMSGEEGVKQALGASPDLILMDLMMPNMDGFEALKRMRSNGVTVPVIAVTGNATETDRLHAMDAGFDDFLKKPFRIDDLLGIIELYLG